MKNGKLPGKVWTSEDVLIEVLRHLKNQIESIRENEVDKAIFAVPIGFSASKKNCLRKAAKKVGINIPMFVSEPTAAFCSNYQNLQECKNVAVFDWGGGTLDISILEISNGYISEIAQKDCPMLEMILI